MVLVLVLVLVPVLVLVLVRHPTPPSTFATLPSMPRHPHRRQQAQAQVSRGLSSLRHSEGSAEHHPLVLAHPSYP